MVVVSDKLYTGIVEVVELFAFLSAFASLLREDYTMFGTGVLLVLAIHSLKLLLLWGDKDERCGGSLRDSG